MRRVSGLIESRIIVHSMILLILVAFLCDNLACAQHLEAFTSGTKFGRENITVWGAMILTDPSVSVVMGRDFHKIPQGVNGTQADNALLRIENGKSTCKELPFPIDLWYSVYSQSCPHRFTKGNDRGVYMAHHQIWADFVHRGKKGIDKDIAKDSDVLVVLEDDAVIAVTDIYKSLDDEISNMKTDLVFLGWCYGRRNMPMCTHAYALTRSGAKKIVEEWDTCSIHSIDGQWKDMANSGIFTWRKAYESSYSNVKPGFEDEPGFHTRGIFVQRNGLVSFNHHGFQNNANGMEKRRIKIDRNHNA